MLSPEKITRAEFDEALGRYPALIKSISSSKTPAKDAQGALTLEQLDQYRFEVAPTLYYKKVDLEDPKAAPTPLSLADVVQLVRWKLKHGTFRPNLMKLAESNSEDEIKKVTLDAFEIYKSEGFNVTKALNKLIALKGIGPATASLLLSVHDASKVVFFSDEVFLWLCHSGKKVPIKYTTKEYDELSSSSHELINRLNIDARDLEKVAFVLMREASPAEKEVTENSTKEPTKARKAAPIQPREPTDMTKERKSQLIEVAAKGRVARVAKAQKRLEKGQKFRERVDAARARKKEEPGIADGKTEVKMVTKRKSEVTTRGLAASAKRSRRSDA